MKRLADLHAVPRTRWCTAALLAVACLGAMPARALEVSDLKPEVVGLHLVSHHFSDGDRPGGYRNENPGVYARWKNGFTLGTYRNSVSQTSAYIGWTFSDSHDRFAITLGAVSGYNKRKWVQVSDGLTGFTPEGGPVYTYHWEEQETKRILPLIAPSVRIGLGGIHPSLAKTSLRLSVLVPPGHPAAVHLSAEYKF